MKTKFLLFDLPISDVSLEEACLLAQKRRKNAVSLWVMADFGLALRCKRQEEVLSACLAADRIFAEGKEMRVAAAMVGSAMENRAFAAKDLLGALMQTGQDRFFFLGGKKGMARRAAVAISLVVGRLPCPVVGGAWGDFCRKGRHRLRKKFKRCHVL